MNQTLTASAAPDAPITKAEVTHRTRIASIDILRGLVMIIMLMDHVREVMYLHVPVSDPMDANTTSPALFFSRLAAHICAPTFVFLTGLSAWLYSHPPGREPRSATRFLFTRGLFLVFLELTLVGLAWSGPYHTVWLQVIWAIGLSMIILSLALKVLPSWGIAAIGFAIVFGHNLLTPLSFEPGSFMYPIWSILHERNYILQSDVMSIKVTYPVLPWIGVIFLGYFAGPLFSREVTPSTRMKRLVVLGLGSLGLFVILRGFNIYGETLDWVAGETALRTLMSILNVTKYPPSLAFILLTLGLSFLILAMIEKLGNRKLFSYIETYGSAPMFFYLFHLYVLAVFYLIMAGMFGLNQGTRWGVDNYVWIWLATIIFAVLLYWPTAKFAKFKRTTKQKWVRYF